jgi:hypothetical protein
MPYNRTEAAKPIYVAGAYAFPWLGVLAPLVLGALLVAASWRGQPRRG